LPHSSLPHSSLSTPCDPEEVPTSGSFGYRPVLVVEILRAVPPIVWLFLIYFSLGSGDHLQLTTFQGGGWQASG